MSELRDNNIRLNGGMHIEGKELWDNNKRERVLGFPIQPLQQPVVRSVEREPLGGVSTGAGVLDGSERGGC